jgi:hypothetical protein
MEKTTTRNKYPEVSEEISAGRQFAKAARRWTALLVMCMWINCRKYSTQPMKIPLVCLMGIHCTNKNPAPCPSSICLQNATGADTAIKWPSKCKTFTVNLCDLIHEDNKFFTHILLTDEPISYLWQSEWPQYLNLRFWKLPYHLRAFKQFVVPQLEATSYNFSAGWCINPLAHAG